MTKKFKYLKTFDFIKVKLASPFRILEWSTRKLPNGQYMGEVKSSETVNYRTFKPEMDGLFCQRIFGPIDGLKCACGKYEEIFYKNLVCEVCGVELTVNNVRRHRMGHIRLNYPVMHVWYLNSRPNFLALLLEVESCEKILIPSYQNTTIRKYPKYPNRKVQRRCRLAAPHTQKLKLKYDDLYDIYKIMKEELFSLYYMKKGAKFNIRGFIYGYRFLYGTKLHIGLNIIDDLRYRGYKRPTAITVEAWDERIKRIKLISIAYFISTAEIPFLSLHWDLQEYRISREFGDTGYRLKPKNSKLKRKYIMQATPQNLQGAPLIRRELKKLSLKKELIKTSAFVFFCQETLLKNYDTIEYDWSRKWEYNRLRKLTIQAIKRLRLLQNLVCSHTRPEWSILTFLPVIPPALRPIIQLEAGKFATSDLNELYRRIINRNNRLVRLKNINAPLLVIRNEKRMLQESIDGLIDNGRRGQIAINYNNNRPLKSLSDIIKGKYGRFRLNLLGKRVDYSGRSVIVVGPTLKLNQCGLPYEMAVELFQPFIIRELIQRKLAFNIQIALDLINENSSSVDDILEKVILNHPIFLNRAPTLHRLGVQAFEPILIAGKAIKLHPLVCSGFNADFDGDQMAVHIPLSIEAQSECYILLLSPYNFLSPANGEPIMVPSQDMVLGCYYLTCFNISSLLGSNHYFANFEDVLLAYQQNKLELHSLIWVRYNKEFESKMIPCKKKILNDQSSIEYFQDLQIRKDKAGNKIVSYIQTTPGKIIFNYTIQKALNFL